MPEFYETQVVVNSVGVQGPPGPEGPIGPKGDKGIPGIVMVTHGSDPSVPRPDAPVVYWIGSVLPDNGLATDLWYQT